jgi:hypothetical protein
MSTVVLGCMKRAGLAEVGARGTGAWVGFQLPSRNTLYVQGPFAGHKDALSAARGAPPATYAVVGGPYVVTAARGVNLEPQVRKVAYCLRNARSGRRHVYSF